MTRVFLTEVQGREIHDKVYGPGGGFEQKE